MPSNMKLSFALIFALALTCIASEVALSLPGEHDLFKQQSERQKAPRNSIKLRGIRILKSPPKPFCSHPTLYAFYVRTKLGQNGSTIAMYGEPPGDYGSQRCSGDQVFPPDADAWINDSGYGIRVATYVVLGLDQDDYHGPNPESIVKTEMYKVKNAFRLGFENLQLSVQQLRSILANPYTTDSIFVLPEVRRLRHGIPAFGSNYAGVNAVFVFSNVPGSQGLTKCSRSFLPVCMKTWEQKTMRLYGNSTKNIWEAQVGVVST